MDMYYEEYGAGKPLVLLHGFGGCRQRGYPFIPELSERYRLIGSKPSPLSPKGRGA